MLVTYQKPNRCFNIQKSKFDLKKEMPKLPTNECYKFISVNGGYASISFIMRVAQEKKIKELTATTLRVGEKEFKQLDYLYKQKRIEKCQFIIGSIMKENKNKYKHYYDDFVSVCEKNEWEYKVYTNHSKIILMRTDEDYYVLETSSNLNENPKMEQFSFENSKELYEFYYNIIEEVIKL